MNLKVIAISAAFISGLTAAGADADGVIDYFNADFTAGVPSEVTVSDGDGQKLHFLMIQAGFDQGDSWKIFTERPSGNKYVASPSMHETANTPADDRLALPEIFLRGGRTRLRWKIRSINEQSNTPSTYSIIVNGQTVVDKAEAPVGRTWQENVISLEKFQGERVNIVFVNNTTNGEVLGLDDIVVSGMPGAATVSLIPGEYALGNDGFQIGATFTASSSIPVTSVGLSCQIDGTTYTAEADGLDLVDGAQTDLMIDHVFNIGLGSSISYSVTPYVNGQPYDEINSTTTQLSFLPRKKVLLEEGTGMWCGWCPLGIVATDSLHMKYGDDIIPIAIHMNAGSDMLAMDTYASALKVSGAPIGLFDRTKQVEPMTLVTSGPIEYYVMDRGAFGSTAEEFFAKLPEAEIAAEVTGRGARQIEITATTRFAKDVDDKYRIAMVLVEDNVWGRNYYQTNYLANFPNRGPVGNFTELPEMITSNFAFDHVARLVIDNAYNGMEGSVPEEIVPGQEYTFTKNITIPYGVNTDHSKVVVMLLNEASGAAVNVCQVSLSDNSGIVSVTPGESGEHVSVSGNSVMIEFDGKISASLIDMAGRTVVSGAGDGAVTLTAPRKGLYILCTSRQTTRVML